jgi:hypothetical protein
MSLATTVTVTGAAGPGEVVTAQEFTNVDAFTYDTQKEMLSIVQGGKVTDISITAATTFTVTIAATTVVVTVS